MGQSLRQISRKSGRRVRLHGALALTLGVPIGLFVAVVPAYVAGATSQVVNNCTDTTVGGQTDLRQAVGIPGVTLITFGCTGTITLNGSVIDIIQSLTISGPGANILLVSGNGMSQVFAINSGVTATITGLTIEKGMTGIGAGISNNGTLNLGASTISGNTATATGVGSEGIGGGIVNEGILTVTNSTLSGNTATASGEYANPFGGGIANFGTATVVNSTISGNNSIASGFDSFASSAAIYNEGTAVTVLNSTIAGNNSTATGDDSQTDGGGIFNFSFSPLTLAGTIVANNGGGNCAGTGYTDGGYNLDYGDANSCGFTSASPSFDVVDTDPGFVTGLLANNGGPTQTIALSSTSSAVGVVPNPTIVTSAPGNPALCPGTDQRGAPRPGTGETRCDIGAYETQSAQALPNGTTGVVYSVNLTSSFGTAPYSFVVTGSTLPPGLTLSRAGVISGVPTSTGTPTFTFVVSVTDNNGVLRSTTYSIHICGGRFRSC